MSKQKMSKLRQESLSEVTPMTRNQEIAFEYWDDGSNLVLNGSAGTGKTFIALAMALEEVLDPKSPYDRVTIVRSVVPTRDIGFLPGSEEEKIEVYATPYIQLCSELFNDKNAWMKLKAYGMVEFESTSFARGHTWDRTIIILDEFQNLTGHEADTIITRLGNNARLIICGDYFQTDLVRKDDRDGCKAFLHILSKMTGVEEVTFTWTDIVRSGLVRDYIMTKEQIKRDGEVAIPF